MIKGLRLRVTCAELKEHCLARSGYHAKRAVEKELTLPELKAALEAVKGQKHMEMAAAMSVMNKGGYRLNTESPVEDLEADIVNHRNKALVFQFFASHLFDADYDLEESDLQRLEILKGR
jgi:hypothetical protein